jgi:ferredoxin
MQKYEVIAPVKKGNTKFEVLRSKEDLDNLYLGGITLVPPKQFFIPEEEILFLFNGKQVDVPTQRKKRVIFGLRKCDLNALQIIDRIMKDPLFLTRRKDTFLIGVYCENPDQYCFCNSMNLRDYYDLFFYPEGDSFYISIGSPKSKQLVEHLPWAKKEIKKEMVNYKALDNKQIEKNYRNKIWESDAEKCLSCSACTVYCPTCNCFDIKDFYNPDMQSGKRVRRAASCQLKSFSRVAGGRVFRESRLSRFKHFVYHKLVYYQKHFRRYMCVGCGRCLRVCPTKIDWVETINLLREMNEIKDKEAGEVKHVHS